MDLAAGMRRITCSFSLFPIDLRLWPLTFDKVNLVEQDNQQSLQFDSIDLNLVPFSRELLCANFSTHSLADFDFHDHRPAV
jgi:hypothetical protein